jgi:aerotaxis receptor
MRNNGPLTGKEVFVSATDEIVSSSDTQGTILFCNHTFCRISGYEHEELINQPHNILRHPQMPPEVFTMLWAALKAGKPWMGIVKNRCKNGDHYWVDAYVTPLRDRGQIYGYESVRVKPDSACIPRAEEVYARLRAGQSIRSPLAHLWSLFGAAALTTAGTLILLLLASFLLGSLTTAVSLALLVASLVIGFLSHQFHRNGLNQALAQARAIIHDPVAAYIYTGRSDAMGEILFAQLAIKSRLRTALGRFAESSRELHEKADAAHLQSRKTHDGMSAQQRETSSVAHAMQQMSLAVQEVANGATQTYSATNVAITEVEKGNKVIEGANRAIGDLSGTVGNLGHVLDKLSQDSSKIASVVDVIRGIAEQTNLLALNAAIEAARAGEQGRGFAVVADEVRTLAQRTQESTGHIQEIISNLSKATEDASQNMDSCQALVERSVDEMGNVRNALVSISQSVSSIDQMSHQIAAAAEEQSSMAAEIERNTSAIAEISDRSQNEINASDALTREMAQLSQKQLDLVVRFK